MFNDRAEMEMRQAEKAMIQKARLKKLQERVAEIDPKLVIPFQDNWTWENVYEWMVSNGHEDLGEALKSAMESERAVSDEQVMLEGTAKIVILMRTDLNMRKGKMIAQGGHAVEDLMLKQMTKAEQYHWGGYDYGDLQDQPLGDYLDGETRKKITCRVDSEEQLRELVEKAASAGIPATVITDLGLTEFKGEKKVTCAAIGPAWGKDLDAITGDLKLL